MDRLVTLAHTAAAALLLFVCACGSGSPPPATAATPFPTRSTRTLAPANQDAALESAVDGFILGQFEHDPAFAAWAGRHEYDGRLPDYSPEGLKATTTWLHQQRQLFSGFADDTLDAEGRFHRDYVVSVIDGELFWLEQSGIPYSNPAFYTNIPYPAALSPSIYLIRPYAPLAERMAAFVRYQEALPRALAQVKANLKLPLPATYIDLGVGSFGGLASFFEKDVPGAFAEVKDPDLQARFAIANAAAIKGLQELTDWLKAHKPHATQNFAMGADNFAAMLRATECVDLPLDHLQAIGEADLARNLASLKDACAQFAPGKSLADCVAREEADKPTGGAVEGARKLLAGLRQFIVDKKLVTIPGTEQARVEEAPPFSRWNFAYIESPGPYDKTLPSVYYIAPPDPTWSQADQAAYVPGKADLLFISAHEVWPGHFLQFQHSNRAHWVFGQLFGSYAYAEGWAHYVEEMMYEQGVDGATPEVHIGQLVLALTRDVRYLSAIGLHTGGMTVAESEKMFREQAFLDPGSARQEAARGTFDPGYLNYTLGKLMILQLRQDWISEHPGPDALRAFHDQFLIYGGPPIPLVRAQMLGGPMETKLWTPPATKAAP